jgi:acetolactate synthase-1/2/3 large subunit
MLFACASEERPGPVHLELPEDVAGMETGEISVLRRHPIERPVPSSEAVERAVEMILAAKRPVVMIGAAGNRPRLVEPLSAFVRAMGLPFFNTQMGKGAVDGGSNLYIGTAALSERDYVHEAIDRADLIICIGHDTVEKPPFLMRRRRAEGDPCRLCAGDRRAGLSSRRGGDRRHRRAWKRCRRSSAAGSRPTRKC